MDQSGFSGRLEGRVGTTCAIARMATRPSPMKRKSLLYPGASTIIPVKRYAQLTPSTANHIPVRSGERTFTLLRQIERSNPPPINPIIIVAGYPHGGISSHGGTTLPVSSHNHTSHPIRGCNPSPINNVNNVSEASIQRFALLDSMIIPPATPRPSGSACHRDQIVGRAHTGDKPHFEQEHQYQRRPFP